MAYSKTTELRNTKTKIKELESKVALLESDLELSDTLYKTYQRIQDETESDLNESEEAVDKLLEAAHTDSDLLTTLKEDLAHYKVLSILMGTFAGVTLLAEVILKAFG